MRVRTAAIYQQNVIRVGLLFLISFMFLMTAAFSASAAPEAKLWPRWTQHDRLSRLSIDHTAWTKFLATYVRTDPRGVNLVAYADVSRAKRRSLDDYIVMLTMAPIGTYSRKEQLAYWINLYNALTVRLILDYFPVKSIMDIKTSPGWFSVGPWGSKLVKVDGVPLSLDDIEHRILRPIWKDPRVHYAVNCASIGCPNLQKKAFTGPTVDAMLDAGARAYINTPRGAEIISGELFVSSIYRWFIDDFGGNNRSVIRHLRRYAAPALEAQLARIVDVSGHRYDWSLNLAPQPE